MRTVTIRSCFFLCAIALALAVTVFADDQEKATTEIKRITSISVDANMRSIVNRTMADMLKVSRLDLVKHRQGLNLNYGGLFLTHQLTAGGAKIEDIAASLRPGKKSSTSPMPATSIGSKSTPRPKSSTRRSTTTSRTTFATARSWPPAIEPISTALKPTRFPPTPKSARTSTLMRRSATSICTTWRLLSYHWG